MDEWLLEYEKVVDVFVVQETIKSLFSHYEVLFYLYMVQKLIFWVLMNLLMVGLSIKLKNDTVQSHVLQEKAIEIKKKYLS